MSRRWLNFWGAMVLTAVAMGLMGLHGPMPVEGGKHSRPHSASFGYMVSAFPYFGALCGELWWRYRQGRLGALLARSLVVCALAAARLLLVIPVSGHTLLVAFVFVEGTRLSDRTLARVWLGGSAIGLAWMLWVKWHLWADYVSSTAGLGLGVGIAVLGPAVLARVTPLARRR